jgi:hypothetical protein
MSTTAMQPSSFRLLDRPVMEAVVEALDPIHAGEHTVRVEERNGSILIHLKPAGRCGHCGKTAEIFVVSDGHSRCATCAYTEAKAVRA